MVEFIRIHLNVCRVIKIPRYLYIYLNVRIIHIHIYHVSRARLDASGAAPRPARRGRRRALAIVGNHLDVGRGAIGVKATTQAIATVFPFVERRSSKYVGWTAAGPLSDPKPAREGHAVLPLLSGTVTMAFKKFLTTPSELKETCKKCATMRAAAVPSLPSSPLQHQAKCHWREP